MSWGLVAFPNVTSGVNTLDMIIIGAALAVSVLSLWVAQRAARRSSELLFCQQRNDLILSVREVREQLIVQSDELTALQSRPLAPLDAAHVTSLWETVNATVAQLDALRGIAESWASQRPGGEVVRRAFDKLHALGMQLDRVRKDIDEIETRTPAAAVETLIPAGA